MVALNFKVEIIWVSLYPFTCVSVFEEVEADCITHKLPFLTLNIYEGQPSGKYLLCIYHLNIKQNIWAVEHVQDCIKYIRKLNGSLHPVKDS